MEIATFGGRCFWCTEAIFQRLKGVIKLEVFFATHDPTTVNRQGSDVGTQYRSVIFYQNDAQKETAEQFIHPPIVTKIEPATTFYPAEDYHKNYYETHKDASYCQLVIDPKIQKLYREFKADLK